MRHLVYASSSSVYGLNGQVPFSEHHGIGREARKDFLPMQPGDVYQTYADSSALAEATGFRPDTPLQEGIDRTVAWFKSYFSE